MSGDEGGRATLSADDVLSIYEQIALYSRYADEGAHAAIGELLADADLYVQQKLVAACDANDVARRFGAAVWPAGSGRRHVVTNIQVEATSPSEANATSYYTFVHTLRGEQPRVLQCGVYKDKFVKREDKWRFRERRSFADGLPLDDA